MFRLGIVALLTVTVFTAPVDANVLCKKRSGALVVRDTTCRPTETPVDLIDLGFDISARVSNSTDIPIPDSTVTALTFDTEEFDTDGIFDPGNPTRLTARTAGKYLIMGYVEFNTSFGANEMREVDIRLNGFTRIARVVGGSLPTAPFITTISTYYELQANDYVELTVRQISGGTLNVHAPEPPAFMMVKLP